MNILDQHDREPMPDITERVGSAEELAALDDESLQKLATEFIMERAKQENPLLGQYNNMFSQWEAMMESYRQEEEPLTQDVE